METSTPVIDRLHAFAQELANYHQEPCLIVLDPPDSDVLKVRSSIPYVVLLSQTRADERQAAVETIYPK